MAKKVYQKKKDGELELKGYLPDKTPIEGVGNSVSVAGTTKTVYALSPSALFVPGGLIMGGTAQAAGLVTRGICGVGTPDSTTGACVKDCLYLNYDGDNSYGRKVVLGAGSPGTQLDGGAYTYAAVRGDQMKAYIDKQGFAKASEIGDGDISIYQNGQEVGRFSLNQESGAQINLTDTDTHVDIVDNLYSTSSVAALSAYQGKKLNEKINELKSNGIPVVKVTALPTAAKGLMGKIYIIAHTGHSDDNDYYDEYIVIENKPSSSSVATTYAWEKIGNTDVKLDGYLKTTDIIDALDNQSATNPLSSKQGYLLNQKITEVKTNLEDNYLQIDDYNRQQEDLQHEVTTNSSNIATNKASIATLTTDVANRYTKGETDNLVNQNIPVVGNRQAYGYWGGGTYSYCLVCKIKIATAWQSTDLRFEYGGNSGPLNTVVVYLSVADSLTSNYSFKIWSFANTNYKFWIKDMGNGEANVYCDITGTQGYLYITRVYGRMLDLHQVTMVMGNAESIPDGAVSTAPYLWADYAQSADNANKATTADTATTATYLPYRRIESFNENPLKTLFQGYNASTWSQKGQVVVPQIAYGNDSIAQFGMIGEYSSGIAWWSGGDMGGALSISKGDASSGKRATIANYRGDGLDWWRYLVLSSNGSDIASQTVKDFTATEIGHGCKFNGDLQSTSLTYSPKMTTIGGLPVSESNSPEADKTITGARTIRFGTSTFSLDFKRNAFMDYFFDHGYHIDNETEASTFFEDVGIVVYDLKTYLCTFKYYSNSGTTDFTAKQILTAGELDDLSLTGFDFADGKFTGYGNSYEYTLPSKGGKVALLSDIPDITQVKVINNLTSNSWVDALSAYQGKVLNERIKKGFQFVAKVDSTTWNIPYTANTRVCYLIIIAYKDSAGFQYVNGTNNPVSVVAINPLFTIDLTPGSSTLRGHGDITDFGAPSNPKVTFLSNTVAYIYKIWGSEY